METILDPGYYILLPRTTGCMLKGKNDQMFNTNPQMQTTNYFESENNLTDIAKDALKEVFSRFDSLSRGYLDEDEFYQLLKIIEHPSLEKLSCKEEFEEIVNKHGSLVKNGIDFMAFIKFITAQVRLSSIDANVALMKYFTKLGYSESLVNESYRMFTLTILCKPLSASILPAKIFVQDNVVTDLDRTASELILARYGEVIS